MIRVRPVHLVLMFVWIVSSIAGVGLAETGTILPHRAYLQFDTTTNEVLIQDEMMVPPGLTELRLGAGFEVTKIVSLDNAEIDVRTAVELTEDAEGPYQKLNLQHMGLRNGGRVHLTYRAKFLESVDDVVFSRENVGGEITATISVEGIYLSSAAEWLPWAEGTMATYELVVDTPEGFETVTQGERLEHRVAEGTLRTRWLTTHPSDGINLIANRYFVHEEPVRDGVVSMTFFLEDDARLRATYMERTKAYIAMYEEMIGPYPYAKFATVENWFPTGYGMPSYTLLGGQVLRLPFIPYTSFGHEIAHNWWGNSVFVDISEGNWCEGLTVYCADYHYKELESADAAREYRRNNLKDYAAYTRDAANDFPLSEFKSRHSGATRAVGYGKSMMVFHMMSRLIGPENFGNALRLVAADHQYEEAAWSDFMAAFAEAGGGQDLETFQAQWLSRTGAPNLSLGEIEFQDDQVELTIVQAAPTYELEVPVVVTTKSGSVEHLVRLDSESTDVTIAGQGIREVAIDPEYHLFRHLHSQEIEATITQVLADDAPIFTMGDSPPIMQAAGQAFAVTFSEDDAAKLLAADSTIADGHAKIIINPAAEDLKLIAPPELKIAGSMIFLAGKRYARDKYDLVFAVTDPLEPTMTNLVILCDSPQRLESLASRVGHYGKYSWLMLPVGSGRPDRGNWSPGESPLTAYRTARK